MKNRIAYAICGVFLVYFGLEDLNNFNILYNGIPLAIGIIALVMAIVEYIKDKKKSA